jgi:hypothetical protein
LTQIYDPKTDKWSSGAPIPTPVSGAGVGAITGAAAPKAIYVVGGETDLFSPQNLTQVYFPENNSWSLGASLPIVRSRLCGAVVNDRLYAIGGTRAVIHQGLTDNEQYTPFGYRTILPSALPSPSQSPTASPNQTQVSTQEMLYGTTVAIVIVVIVAVVFSLRKRHKGKSYPSNG